MATIGDTLRRERLRRGLDLDQVSRQTKISLKFLESIEAEKFDQLPGGVFTKSFVRQYARTLGLDEEEIGAELQPFLQNQSEPALSKHYTPVRENHFPSGPSWSGVAERLQPTSSFPAFIMVVVVMLACSGIYAWWQNAKTGDTTTRPASAVTSRKAPETLSGAVMASTPATGSSPSDESSPAASESAPASESKAAAEVPSPAADPQAFPVNVELATIGNNAAWISVTSDGKRVFAGVLKNESKKVEAFKKIRISTGSAGALSVSLNGKSIGPIGNLGQTRTVELTADGFQIISSKPAPAIWDPL